MGRNRAEALVPEGAVALDHEACMMLLAFVTHACEHPSAAAPLLANNVLQQAVHCQTTFALDPRDARMLPAAAEFENWHWRCAVEARTLLLRGLFRLSHLERAVFYNTQLLLHVRTPAGLTVRTVVP